MNWTIGHSHFKYCIIIVTKSDYDDGCTTVRTLDRERLPILWQDTTFRDVILVVEGPQHRSVMRSLSWQIWRSLQQWTRWWSSFWLRGRFLWTIRRTKSRIMSTDDCLLHLHPISCSFLWMAVWNIWNFLSLAEVKSPAITGDLDMSLNCLRSVGSTPPAPPSSNPRDIRKILSGPAWVQKWDWEEENDWYW